MQTARPGIGTRVYRGDGGSPEAFVEVTGVMSVTAPRSIESTAIDTTDMSVLSTQDGFREYINAGVKNQPVIAVKMQYLPGDAVHELVRGDVGVPGAGGNYRIEFPTVPTQTWTGAAIVVAFRVQALELESLIEAEFELQPSGEWTLA